jgi:hypothetical protein
MSTLAGSGLLLPVAHAGHWYFWPLYALPLLIVLWSVVRTTIRERRDSRRDRGEKS